MGEEIHKAGRRKRADSVRNRERLLDAARAVFSAGGPDASMEAVARKAELGIGTLYRNFPSREALFQAVYSREVDELVDLGAALAEESDPVDALRKWMRGAIRMVATKRGMLAALSPTFEGTEDFYADTARRLAAAVAALMRRGVAAGRLRDDITPEEVMQAFVGICYTKSAGDWRASVLRLLDIFVDGLELRP